MGANVMDKDPEAVRDEATKIHLVLPLPQLIVLTPAQTRDVAGGLVHSRGGCSPCGMGSILPRLVG
jgi:hypothetical protein